MQLEENPDILYCGVGTYGDTNKTSVIFNNANNIATGEYSMVSGSGCEASGTGSYASGLSTKATGPYCHTEGFATVASGVKNAGCAHAEGSRTVASGEAAHSEGMKNRASGKGAHSEGLGYGIPSKGPYYFLNEAEGSGSHVEGLANKAASNYQHVQGKWNIIDSSGEYAFIIGNGYCELTENEFAATDYNEQQNYTHRNNAFAVDWNGNTYSYSTNTIGADYAEYFEWLDKNASNEDRIGYIVSLNGDKLQFANKNDDILGIVTGTAGVIGDNSNSSWKYKYLTDNFGRILYHDFEEKEYDS